MDKMQLPRLPHMLLEFDGRTWDLVCNFNVVCDVQEAYGGNIMAAFRRCDTLKACREFLTAMLNDAAETLQLPVRYTSKQVGRMIAVDPASMEIMTKKVATLVRKSIVTPEEEQSEAQEEPQKNG